VTAFDREALYNKSKVFVDRALKARDDSDAMEFHLWSALALEVLGKATLSSIHPSLVADPNHFKSLLAACGITKTTSLRSVAAKTTFERLTTVVPEFDEKSSRECMLMVNRRNAELHSGESPVAGLDARSWVPLFWRAASILIAAQGRTLEDWLGTSEAERVAEILRDSAETLRQTVLGRIERRRAAFAASCPPESMELRDAEQRARVRPAPSTWDGEAYEPDICPACGLDVWVLGHEEERDVIDEGFEGAEENGYYGYFLTVRVTYRVESFHCPECGLELEGREELDVTDLATVFERDEDEEPDYEPDYGND